VQWAKDSTTDQRAAATAEVAKTSDVTLLEVSGDERQTTLKAFGVKSKWYSLSEVDRLSVEEADIIAARLVRRVKSRIELSSKKESELKKELAGAFKRVILGAREITEQSIEEAVLSAGRAQLSEAGLEALKHALALGIRPAPGDKSERGRK
jgi:predicted DNA binding protein